VDESQKNSRVCVLATCSLIIGVVAVILSVVAIVYMVTDNEGSDDGSQNEQLNKIIAKLNDLEEEYEYILENLEKGVSKRNRPNTLEDGKMSLPTICKSRPDPGPCSDVIDRWYFLESKGDCVKFPWGGCGGNENRFLSLHQCRVACRVEFAGQTGNYVSMPDTAPPPVPTLIQDDFDSSSCDLSPDAGPCTGRLTRFYFSDGTCRKFEYGGCHGNKNNFFTEEDCMRHCKKDVIKMKAKKLENNGRRKILSCSLPPEEGTCDGNRPLSVTRWYFDRGDCIEFVYSGCGGNSNNFMTRDKCLQRCAGQKHRIINV